MRTVWCCNICREEFPDADEGGVHVADQHEGVASLIEYEDRACGSGLI